MYIIYVYNIYIYIYIFKKIIKNGKREVTPTKTNKKNKNTLPLPDP